jgi:phosphoribosylformylglycinamidine cyclo-ligase
MAEKDRVDIGLGDEMSDFFYQGSIKTRENRPDCLDLSMDSFEGAALVKGSYFAEHINQLSFGHELDGIGTKPFIRERLNEHRGSAHDLFAMVGDDVVCRGGEIITIDTVLEVRRLDRKSKLIIEGMRGLVEGMIEAAKLSHAVVQTGEVAELGSRVAGYGDFNYNWSGVAWFAVHRERMFTGKELQAGDSLVGLVDPGFRSNGITDVRTALEETYGPNWHGQIEPSLGNIALGKLVQTPSVIYAGLMTDITGGFNPNNKERARVSAIAHITGGGQPSKLGRMLKRSPGLGIEIDNPIVPPNMMLHLQRLNGFSDRETYGKWHMGPGMVVATRDPEVVIEEAKIQGVEAKKIGHVIDSRELRIKNMGAQQLEEWLTYPLASE